MEARIGQQFGPYPTVDILRERGTLPKQLQPGQVLEGDEELQRVAEAR